MQQRDIVFIDTEVDPVEDCLADIGAVKTVCPVCSVNGLQLHTGRLRELEEFLQNVAFICGHNIINFDSGYIMPAIKSAGISSFIDTLYLSPLLFPHKPYHKLLKDDKLQSDDLNNPLNDAKKSMELFMDEVSAFHKLDESLKKIYCTLLDKVVQFRDFFRYMDYHEKELNLQNLIRERFHKKICANAELDILAASFPIELAYCLAVIDTGDRESIIPYWVQKTYPKVQDIYHCLCGVPCEEGCEYCNGAFDIYGHLKKKFGYESFRKYNGEPLQEKAVQAAVKGKSLLVVFPTGGGKSITFQLPALMAAEATHGLTVVISPLQSLMKDQVDNLSQRGITDAVTINGLLNVVERAEALERVENGIASILYIAPESLRSKTIERLLLGRNIVRFVIDEAHCFSSWGQDFRVDYLYIGDFIAKLQEMKGVTIPVSCFTATAKQKVISDIREYFKQKLNLVLELYTTNAARANLRYEVLYRQNDSEKYATLRNLIEQKNCPTICYVSRTKRTEEIAKKLCDDGFDARAFHGKMQIDEKIANQEAFIQGNVQIIVATSAFGMGVDKKDVRLVVHYDISDSLENYVQEAGRAGRDENIQAECYILFNENDLDKHFMLLNQTKLSINEIQQVWKAIKNLTKSRNKVYSSALEIARQAGWSESGSDVETKVRTAITALELSGYLKRGQNCPRVYADSIQVKTAKEAIEQIAGSLRFDERQKENATRIIKKLISTRSRARAKNDEAESRVDYMADILGIDKKEVIEAVNLMREDGLLASDKEMFVYVEAAGIQKRVRNTVLAKYLTLEGFLLEKLQAGESRIRYKAVNEEALDRGIKTSSVNAIQRILYFWIIKGYIKKPEGEINDGMQLKPVEEPKRLRARYEKRSELAQFASGFFYDRAREVPDTGKDNIVVNFSIQELQRAYNQEPKMMPDQKAVLKDMEEALLYLSRMDAFRLEGGFLVLYNAMEITRLEMDNKRRYKLEDYRQLKEFYNSKTQQIHIVGEYANMMVRDYESALIFVNDYFHMEYKLFLTKYFKGARLGEIERNITPMKYKMLFENLSARQSEIICDDTSKTIVVAAGPGSGKTRILVHKLAALMLLEDVKHEQLLMLTFSRAAVMEFKKRLVELIGNAAYFVEIKTFHSYCFDLLGKTGCIKNAENVVSEATDMIRGGDVELDRITKTVLVLDEAQDMDKNEFALICALMERNEDLRLIAVGDDDQNIYGFRGADSRHMASLLSLPESKKYELTDNYRSSRRVIDISNEFIKTVPDRMKSHPINPVKNEDGEVAVTYVDSYLESAVAECLERTWHNGTAAVLTASNEQAYLTAEILERKGFRVKMIQSIDGFSLYDLSEMRYFLMQLRQKESPVIFEEEWESAKTQLKIRYAGSECLNQCLNLLEQFQMSNEKMYYSDFETFLREVRFEDFYQADQNEICVSTIHKAKGREFDNVYMILGGQKRLTDDWKRCIYVGMTRAKSNLYICHNTGYFQSLQQSRTLAGIRWLHDATRYPMPEEIVLPLTHRDVWLGFFEQEGRSDIAGTLRSGDKLRMTIENYRNGGRIFFSVTVNSVSKRIACCSKIFYEKLFEQQRKGYQPKEAKVLYVLAWKDKENGQEYNIILPIIRLKKM